MTTVNQAGLSNPRTSLYVGDLHSDVTDAELLDAFSTAGPISRIRVCRDQMTERSLGYAFVKFEREEDAKRALGTMDTIKGQPIKIIWSVGDGNVFIKNLDKSMDNKALYDIFSAFGDIFSCKVICDEHGSSAYGFVLFETEEAARNAIYKVNGILLNGKRVYVSREMNEDDIIEIQADQKKKFNNVYVKNFGDKMSKEELKVLFEPYGKITSLKIMTDIKHKSRGFGFVYYQNPDDAQKAVEELNGKIINEQTLYVGRAQNKIERQNEMKNKIEEIRQKRINRFDGLNVYVKNLDEDISDERLKNEFAQFGRITSAKVMTTENGRSKGFGFVCFSSAEEANKAVTEMNCFYLGNKPLYVHLAQRKDVRQAMLATEYLQRITSIRTQGQSSSIEYPTFPSNGPENMLPLMTEGPRNVYVPTPLQQMSPVPRWQLQPTQTTGFHNIPVPQTRAAYPTALGAQTTGHVNIGMHAAMLANAYQQEHKQMLGKRLFQLIQIMYPDLAGKITGILLKKDNLELSKMVESKELLDAQVREAIAVLQAQQANECATLYTRGMMQVHGQEPLTAAMMATASSHDQRQTLKDILFSLINNMYPDFAQTVTEMLLEINNSELLVIMESKESFESKVHEAVAVLQSNQAIETATHCVENAILIQNQEPLTVAMLANASQQQQKQMLGERLFPMIYNMYPNQAEKITGMLLEMDNSELLNMLKSKELLEDKVREAVAVLESHHAKESPTSTNIPVEIKSVPEQLACIPVSTSGIRTMDATPSGVPKQAGSYPGTQTENPLQIENQQTMIMPQRQSACMMSQMFPSAGPGYILPNVSQGQTIFSPQTLVTFPTPADGQYPLSTNHMAPRILQANLRADTNFQNSLENLQRSEGVRPDNVSEDINSAINDIIYEIALRPGNLEETTSLIAQILQNCSGDQVISSILHVVDILFEKSISEPSFQCTGAKLVKYLSNKLRTVPAFANFRNFFLTRCKEEYLIREELISNPDTVPRLCGFAHFIGDLFLNWEVTTCGVVQRIPVLRFVMRDLLLVLLKHSTDDSVTCATEILKRAGAVIEETAHLNRPAEGNFSEVFSRLSQLELHDLLNESTKCSITTLLKLKSRNWERRDSSRLRSTRSVTKNEQADHESSIESITLAINENMSVGKDNQKSGNNMDDKYLCKICFDNPVEVTFLPCMHVCCCKNCSDKLKVKQCPICRKKIKESRPLYFA